MQPRHFPILACVVMFFSLPAFAQTSDRRQSNPPVKAQDQTSNLPPNANSGDVVAKELGQLGKSLQTLNVRLREIIDKVLSTDSTQSGSSKDNQNRLSLNLELLTRAEQRAEFMRKQLFELIEKETSLKSRIVQIEEDMRPESIERTMNLVGSTRTAEIRDTRRRVLENERRGFESLLTQTAQSRVRLDDDLKQADSLVYRLRQRILPMIEKEIEKINPN